MKVATLDHRRRLVMPPECPPGAAVTIQRVDAHTWIVKHQLPDTNLKVIAIPVIDKLPDDPEWEAIEAKMAKSVSSRLRPPG